MRNNLSDLPDNLPRPLPTFEFDGDRLIKRMAFYIDKNKIEKVFYPVFPPDKNASKVLAWLKKLVGLSA